MDLYTAERLFLERRRELSKAAERRGRLTPQGQGSTSARIWMAGWLRAVADRIEGRPQLQRV